MAAEVALFFALFAAPSSILALLALREFLHRGVGGQARLRRASLFLLLAAALAGLLVVVASLATGGAPLRTAGGAVFLGWGAAQVALGPTGAWLFRRAAAAPLRRTIKAAETVPMLVVLLNLVLVFNAAVQA